MSQAAALLASLEDQGTPYINEEYIVIDRDRVITVPEKLKRIAVQYDHNIETVTFACPRYWDDHDMSKMVVYINYRLPNGTVGSYIADNVRVDENDSSRMFFDWTIMRGATQVDGSIAILVCIKKLDDDGNEVNHWNSELNKQMFVSEGMEIDNEPDSEEYNDILTQLLLKLDTASAEITAVTEAEIHNALDQITRHADAVRASLPVDYVTAVDSIDTLHRSKADAIVRKTDGDIISIEDSSDDLLRGLQIFGKTKQRATDGIQLFNIRDVRTGHYTSVLDDDDWNTSKIDNTSGTSIVYKNVYCNPQPLLLPSTRYNVVVEVESISNATLHVNTDADVSPSQFIENWSITEPGKHIKTLTTKDSFDSCLVCLRSYVQVAAGASGNARFRITILASQAITIEEFVYEPYTGGEASPSPKWPQELNSIENPKVSVLGANLFNVNTATFRPVNGLTGNINPDGSITVNGTPALKYAQVCSGTVDLPKGTYYVSGGQNAAGCAYFQLYANLKNGGQKYAINGVFVVDGTEKESVHYSIQSGNTLDPIENYTLYPMFNAGETQMSFEEYKTVGTLTPNRTLCGIPVEVDGNYTDANGQEWICDEINFERGVYIQRIKKLTITGEESWSQSQYYPNTMQRSRSSIASGSKYLSNMYAGTTLNDNLSIVVGGAINVRDDEHATDVTTWTRWLSDMYAKGTPLVIMGILQDPVEIPLTVEELEYYKTLHTNFPITTIFNNKNAVMKIKYNVDTATFINDLHKESPEPTFIDLVEMGMDAVPIDGSGHVSVRNTKIMDAMARGPVKFGINFSVGMPRPVYTTVTINGAYSEYLGRAQGTIRGRFGSENERIITITADEYSVLVESKTIYDYNPSDRIAFEDKMDLMPETDIIFSSTVDEYRIADIDFVAEPILGETYMVTLDDTTYYCSYQYVDGVYFIGNPVFINPSLPDDMMPFVIIKEEGSNWRLKVPRTDWVHRATVHGFAIKKIDPKFIPDTASSSSTGVIDLTELFYEQIEDNGRVVWAPLEPTAFAEMRKKMQSGIVFVRAAVMYYHEQLEYPDYFSTASGSGTFLTSMLVHQINDDNYLLTGYVFDKKLTVRVTSDHIAAVYGNIDHIPA